MGKGQKGRHLGKPNVRPIRRKSRTGRYTRTKAWTREIGQEGQGGQGRREIGQEGQGGQGRREIGQDGQGGKGQDRREIGQDGQGGKGQAKEK